MVRKKTFLIVGIILISCGLSYLIYNKINQQLDITKHNTIINRDFYSGETNKTDNLEYLIIPDLNIKRIIADNSDEETLNQYYVGKVATDINNDNHIILAGHNVKQVFHALHKIKLGTLIILKSKQKEEFIVNNKYETLKNDRNVLETVTHNKQLTMITCTNDPNYRLIVTAIKKAV